MLKTHRKFVKYLLHRSAMKSGLWWMGLFLWMPAASQAASWALSMEGFYGDMSFASDQNASAVELRRTDDARRSVFGRVERTRKFDQSATGGGMGVAFPIALPRSAVAFSVSGAPNQDIVPLSIVDTSFIHDPAGWLETVMRYRFAHYAISNIHLISPTIIWMPRPWLQGSAAYYWTLTDFLGGATVPNHSVSTRWLVRPVRWAHPWAAYTRSEESFEAGAGATREFSAHHYLAGVQMPLSPRWELHPSFEYERRSNKQILRTGAMSVTLRW